MTISVREILEGIGQSSASPEWLEEAAKFYDTAKAPKKKYPLYYLELAFKESDFPKEKVVYIRDPGNLLVSKETIEGLMGEIRKKYWYMEPDFEQFADGPGPLGGEWNYAVEGAADGARAKSNSRLWNEVKVIPVKGKTGAGWKIEFPMSEKDIREYEFKQMEKAASQMAKEGIYPESVDYPSGSAYFAIAKKYYEMGKKKKGKAESASPESILARMSAVLGEGAYSLNISLDAKNKLAQRAAADYANGMKRIKMRLSVIEKSLKKHGDRVAKDPSNLALMGDLQYVESRLKEVQDFLQGEEEDWQ